MCLLFSSVHIQEMYQHFLLKAIQPTELCTSTRKVGFVRKKLQFVQNVCLNFQNERQKNVKLSEEILLLIVVINPFILN